MAVQMQPQEFGVVEAGKFPEMIESPDDLQQEFICKVYLIIAIQLLLTMIGVVAVVILIQPLAYSLRSSSVGLPFYLVICIVGILVMCLSYCYHFASYMLLGVLTAALTLLVGLSCVVATGKAILDSVILTSVISVNLTLYTFWAASKGHDFEFLGPFLFCAIAVIIVLASIQILYPLGRVFFMIYGCFGSIAFCGYIVCVTDSLIIKSHAYERYIWAAVSLYVDLVNIFLLFLSIYKAVDC
ncbi:Transmembrane BAX inhibitor motif-containing protein, putative [Ricinus communis]|uniref:Transmembrane BAX inhibitor motif-containing protein, putative n=2 Tax=Ricinus communis TaxID=3988 RepID=B9SFF8_RICCO|nr:Transmembrane BAX inhibitor motif-containing protein, putative [Ricinus communis]